MSIETRLKKIEKEMNIDFKPKLFGDVLLGCIWTEEDEKKLLAKAIKLNTNLPRPLLGRKAENEEDIKEEKRQWLAYIQNQKEKNAQQRH